MKSISKKTAIITGASKGLGAHIALYLAKSKFNLVLTYNSNKKNAEKIQNKISKTVKSEIMKCDVTKFSDISSVVNKTTKHFGRIDLLVNNTGIHNDISVARMSNEDWDSVIKTNLNGTFSFSKAVLPQMKKQKFGRIINISSYAAFTGLAGAANYVASKAGIIGFSKSLAKEVAKDNITVNVIAPGYFDTGMFYDLPENTRNKILQEIPSKRLGKPNEISELIKILFISDYLTGQVFVLDGGYSA